MKTKDFLSFLTLRHLLLEIYNQNTMFYGNVK